MFENLSERAARALSANHMSPQFRAMAVSQEEWQVITDLVTGTSEKMPDDAVQAGIRAVYKAGSSGTDIQVRVDDPDGTSRIVTVRPIPTKPIVEGDEWPHRGWSVVAAEYNFETWFLYVWSRNPDGTRVLFKVDEENGEIVVDTDTSARLVSVAAGLEEIARRHRDRDT